MSVRALRTCLLAGVVSVSWPSLAAAAQAYPECGKTPSEADVVAAKGAFQAGQAAFNEADYSRAITYWEDAYRRDCTAHALLLNLSRAYELNEQLPEVVVALQTYNERTPNSQQREQNERRIERIIKEIEDRDAVNAPPPAAEGGSPAGAATTTAAQEPTAFSSSVTADTQPESTTGRPLYPLYVAGGGAVLGVVSGLIWRSKRSEYLDFLDTMCPMQNANGDAVCPGGEIGNRADELESATTLPGVLAVTGLVVAAGGIAWYFLQPQNTESAQLATSTARPPLRLTPAVGPGALGLLVDGVLEY